MTGPNDNATLTAPLEIAEDNPAGPPVPGIVIVFAAGQPVIRTMTVGREPIELGREALPSGTPKDVAMSRRHARVSQQGRRCASDRRRLRPTSAASFTRSIRTSSSMGHSSRPA